MTASNPYRWVGQVAADSRFIDRPDLMERVLPVWQDAGRPSNLSVLGHHRTGKTSLVRHAFVQNEREELAKVWTNVGLHTTGIDLFKALVTEVVDRFGRPDELCAAAAPVGAAREWHDVLKAVTDFFTTVRRSGRFVLVVLDEFDRAASVLTTLAEFQLLRDLASESKYPVGLITISRRRIKAIEIDAARGSILDGVVATRCPVGMFTAAQGDLMLARAADCGIDLESVREQLLDRAGLHPFLLEQLCMRVVEIHQTSGRLDVDAAYGEEIERFHSQFAQLVRGADLDSAGRGSVLLRRIAAGEQPTKPSLDLNALLLGGLVARAEGGLALFSPEFGRYLLGAADDASVSAPTAADEPDDRSLTVSEQSARCCVLAIATEWWSRNGGLSTFNRDLCRALARAGAHVLCLVLTAQPEEVADASDHGVVLLRAEAVAGADEMVRLARRPVLPGGAVPDIVIGHGRITGPVACVQAADHFPNAKRLHFVHMAPDEIEWHKLDRDTDAGARAEERTELEIGLGRGAYRVVAVGPRLHNRFVNELSPFDCPEPLRLDPGFDPTATEPRTPPGGQPWKVLLMGRTEDAQIKGLDLAARACGLVAAWRHEAGMEPLELVVRGAPADSSDRQRKQLMEWAGNPRLGIVVRPFSADTERLSQDLRRASLLMMPSRSEGFGLVGQEAVAVGTPVLVSGSSGLGELLSDPSLGGSGRQCVVPMSGNDDADVETWARAVDYMLRDRQAAFSRAELLRRDLSRDKTWSGAVEGLLEEVGY